MTLNSVREWQGSPFNRADLRSISINFAYNTVILSANNSITGDVRMVDKDVVMAYMNIKSMTFDHVDGVHDDKPANVDDPADSEPKVDALQQSETDCDEERRPRRLHSRFSVHDLHTMSKEMGLFNRQLSNRDTKEAHTVPAQQLNQPQPRATDAREKQDASHHDQSEGGAPDRSSGNAADQVEVNDSNAKRKRTSFGIGQPFDNSALSSRSGNVSDDTDERPAPTVGRALALAAGVLVNSMPEAQAGSGSTSQERALEAVDDKTNARDVELQQDEALEDLARVVKDRCRDGLPHGHLIPVITVLSTNTYLYGYTRKNIS